MTSPDLPRQFSKSASGGAGAERYPAGLGAPRVEIVEPCKDADHRNHANRDSDLEWNK